MLELSLKGNKSMKNYVCAVSFFVAVYEWSEKVAAKWKVYRHGEGGYAVVRETEGYKGRWIWSHQSSAV